MNRNYLIAIAVGALILSNSNIGLAQAGPHKGEKKSHSKQIKPIKLRNGSEVRIFETSTATPKPHFDTSTAGPKVEIDDEDENMPRFDTSTVTSQSDDSEDSDQQKERQGDQEGKHEKQGDQGDSFSGTLPAAPLGTRND